MAVDDELMLNPLVLYGLIGISDGDRLHVVLEHGGTDSWRGTEPDLVLKDD